MDVLHHYLRPPVRHANLIYLTALVLLVSGTWFAWNAFDQHRMASHMQDRNAKLAAMVTTSKAPTANRAEQENLKKWIQLTVDRDYPWSRVFRAVEKSASTDIELLEFKPDKMNHTIALSGEAHDRKALINYLEQLSRQAALTDVYLVHQQTIQRDTLETISFEIKATLKE